MRRRIVATGMGVICSAGNGVQNFTKALLSGKHCLKPIEDVRINHFNARFAGLVDRCDYPDSSTSDRFFQFAAIAADEALKNSGLTDLAGSDKAGVLLGTCSGPMLTIETIYHKELQGQRQFSSDDLFAKQYYAAVLQLASRFGFCGPALTVTTACSAFNAAVATACDLLQAGFLDIALVGGADSFSTTTLAGFAGLKATSNGICAPFSRPSGLNLGEGAGFFVLESLEHAESRHAKKLCEILGYGLSNDAYHCSAPDPSGKGAALSMQRALEKAGIDPDIIRYISAHGTGTEANDKAETKAIRKVFGDLAGSIPVSSTKSVVGHCLGAAGAIETIATLVCAQNEVYPSTVNFSAPREGCTLDYVPDCNRLWQQGTVFLKNNFAFGGNNACLIVSTDQKTAPSEVVYDSESDPICISGIGIVSAAGVGLKRLLEAHAAKTSFFQKGEFTYRPSIDVAEVPYFELASIDRRLNARGMDRSGKIATAAAALALKHALVSERPSVRGELGFYMNIAHGSTWAEPEHIKPLLANGFQLDQINVFPFIVPNSVTGTVCRALSLTGHNSTYCNGPGAGLTGLSLSWASLINGHASTFLCGAVDDIHEFGSVDCIFSENAHDQIAAGEGAAMVVVERQSRAIARGATPLCYIKSACISTDTRSGRNQLQATISRTMEDAQIGPDQIGVVCCNNQSRYEIETVRKSLGGDSFCIIDLSSVTGFSPASIPLFNLATSLYAAPIGIGESKNYILMIFSSNRGLNCAMILQRTPDLKELPE